MGNQSIAFSNLAFNSKCRLTKAFGQFLPGGLAGLLSTDRWRVDLKARAVICFIWTGCPRSDICR
jgi:hypothetical protein